MIGRRAFTTMMQHYYEELVDRGLVEYSPEDEEKVRRLVEDYVEEALRRKGYLDPDDMNYCRARIRELLGVKFGRRGRPRIRPVRPSPAPARPIRPRPIEREMERKMRELAREYAIEVTPPYYMVPEYIPSTKPVVAHFRIPKRKKKVLEEILEEVPEECKERLRWDEKRYTYLLIECPRGQMVKPIALAYREYFMLFTTKKRRS